MTLLFCDGFDHYSGYAPKGWNALGDGYNPSTSAGNGRFGTAGFSMGDPRYGATHLIDGHTQGVLGFALRMGAFYSGQRIASIMEGGTHHLALHVSSGALYVVSGSTTLATGTSNVFGAPNINVWQYIELAYVIHDTTGSFTVYVQGQSYMSASNVDTKNGLTGTASGISLGWYNAGLVAAGSMYDDLYVLGGTTTPLGDVRVQSIFPSGAGTTTQMTPSAGSNYACVDETTPNDDTDYVSETTAGEKDTYAFGNLTPTSGTVKGVQVLIDGRKDDAGTRTIAPVYRPASTDYDGTTRPVSDSYSYAVREITEVSPETSVAWTIAEINGAEFGVKLIA